MWDLKTQKGCQSLGSQIFPYRSQPTFMTAPVHFARLEHSLHQPEWPQKMRLTRVFCKSTQHSPDKALQKEGRTLWVGAKLWGPRVVTTWLQSQRLESHLTQCYLFTALIVRPRLYWIHELRFRFWIEKEFFFWFEFQFQAANPPYQTKVTSPRI